MSKIKNAGLDQYGTEPFEQQQFGTRDIDGVNKDLKEPAICKVDAPDRTRLKRLIGKCSVGQWLGSCLLRD